MSKIAGCRNCVDQPLVGTFAFSRYEFYCINCGAKYGWLEPVALNETQEMLDKLAEVEKEWKELGGENLLTGGVMLKSCGFCNVRGEPHINHASEKEQERSEQALRNLSKRAAEERR